MSDLILHHYPPSPVSEKIRTALGFKGLEYRSVEENRLPVRPELFAMTGGYRRIPVLQVGADIYCDTQLIFRELEARVPEPGLYPANNAGLGFGLSRWIDGELFELCVRVAFAPVVDQLPPELVADRTRLYFGPEGDMKREAEDIPHTLTQLRAQFGWLDDQLTATGSAYLHGEQAGHLDLLAWYPVWFVRGRFAGADKLFAEFPNLLSWADHMAAIGHGTATDMTPEEALAAAREATPLPPTGIDKLDPLGLTADMAVTVEPLVQGSGELPVEGRLYSLTRDRVSIARSSDDCGEVVVHFPRIGNRVTPVT